MSRDGRGKAAHRSLAMPGCSPPPPCARTGLEIACRNTELDCSGLTWRNSKRLPRSSAPLTMGVPAHIPQLHTRRSLTLRQVDTVWRLTQVKAKRRVPVEMRKPLPIHTLLCVVSVLTC
jgi:hypothetical protein